ncbi:MAG: hypothetical protein ACHREM_21320 [Polyangiales bacterium]
MASADRPAMPFGNRCASSTKTTERRRARAAAGERGFTLVQVAFAIIVFGTALSVIGVGCWRALRFSRGAEATSYLQRLSDGAVAAAHDSPTIVLSSTPLTPLEVPRGAPVVDVAGTWDHPTFKAAHFAIDEPHWYSYRLEIPRDAASPVHAIAQGDLDGDGAQSTFERSIARRATGWEVTPELRVVRELE